MFHTKRNKSNASETNKKKLPLSRRDFLHVAAGLTTLGLCSIPTNSKTPATNLQGVIRQNNKFVTILYFTWHDRWINVEYAGTTEQHNEKWNQNQFYWWGVPKIVEKESRIPEYRFVLPNGEPNRELINKHADQLVEAGIDFITIDHSNEESSTYPHPDYIAANKAVLNVYKERFEEKKKTPQVVFFYGMSETAGQQKYDEYLSKLIQNYYQPFQKELFFYYEGKPLLLTHSHYYKDSKVISYFTYRRTEGMRDDMENWTFKISNNQKPFISNDWAEEMSVVSTRGLPLSKGRYPKESAPNGIVGRNEGRTFKEQWENVYKVNPTFVFVTGWNEWGAQWTKNLAGEMEFVDQFDHEYSTDLEPLSGGFVDKYYKQICDFVRPFKENLPNFIYRDKQSGTWHFKNYRRNYGAREEKNFVSSVPWTQGATERYQPFVRRKSDGEVDFIGLRDTQLGDWHFRKHTGNYNFAGSVSVQWVGGDHYQPFIMNLSGDLFAIGLRDSSNGTWHFREHLDNFNFAGSSSDEWIHTGHRKFQPFSFQSPLKKESYIGLRNSEDGTFHFRKQKGKFSFGESKSFPWLGGDHFQFFFDDFNGNGVIDLALRDTNTGKIYIASGNDTLHFDHKRDTFQGPANTQLQFV